MAKGHRSQIKRERNENQKDTRPSAKLSYARISVQKACYVLDAIRGKDVETAIGILSYKSKICVKRHFEIITVRSCKCGEQQWYESSRFIH